VLEDKSNPEQGAVLFFNEEDHTWELITADAEVPNLIWENEADALKDLAADGWEIEGPFQMSPKSASLPQVSFVGYGLKRNVH